MGIIGPNGSGKSTLLKTIYRTNKPSGGSVYLNGTEMSRMSNKEIARQMAVVAQENAGSFDFSVMEIMLIASAFSRDPELIVLDEHTTHLDVGYQFLIMV